MSNILNIFSYVTKYIFRQTKKTITVSVQFSLLNYEIKLKTSKA